MTTVFVNGGGPNYLGSLFTTGTGLLTQIRDTLVSAGWNVVLDDITTNEVLHMSAIDNGHAAYVNFSISSPGPTPDNKSLDIQGDKTGAGTILSDIYQLPWVSGVDNFLYMGVDSAGGGICIRSQEVKGVHFGFCERILLTDAFAIYIGYTDVLYSTVQVAESWATNADWFNLTTSFNSTDPFTNGFATIPFNTTFDAAVTCNFYSNFTSTNSQNAGYKAYNGQVNGVNNLPLIDWYGYLEGLANRFDYPRTAADNHPHPLYFRGKVRFVNTGFASLPGGTIVEAGGNVYVSTGPLSWQGLRIE